MQASALDNDANCPASRACCPRAWLLANNARILTVVYSRRPSVIYDIPRIQYPLRRPVAQHWQVAAVMAAKARIAALSCLCNEDKTISDDIRILFGTLAAKNTNKSMQSK